MQRKERAVELFSQKFNCSQAVFAAYRQVDTLDEETALKIATVFGAGVACTGGELCGAVSGALMAISLRYGRGNSEDIEAKLKTYELGKRFTTDFRFRMGSCSCAAVLGLDIGVPGNLEKAGEMKLFETVCLDAVKTASDLLEEIL